MSTRKIFKNATTSQAAARELLSFVLTQELLLPSQHIFLVAPWISNIAILDNRQSGFTALNPEWPRGDVYLVEVLCALATRGAHLHIHVNADQHNRYFESRIKESMNDIGLMNKLTWKVHKYLHTKGIQTDRVLISGSMNLTRNGVQILDESVDVCYDKKLIAGARVHFESYESN